ncbi:hypothetical protein BASA50_006951 [Batrachochytrium salamandrivorans]|uniref:Uncharacterized protein n=1 Tax=Batrachochytrium salamandrivorans TaxID=1357716 RepID=A0ABQ8F904_9FUNG|nr:hypothetical protein BASA60_001464 [Batrachochytrium salamandrivorans]KAH6594045.1 hypothetical protein BASA50_006951 [Batrachochytrium salamandrivorans]KAH6602940.1 hypothetical protein BASA61_000617 [Batrachochytrium salamandrivorans]KAH9270705.1 hypothetical protein BASA83_007065 [Batrachochytrium salamandrivorans]
MIYTRYARIAIIVALMGASVAMPIAQDKTSVHLEKRTPQGDIEDAKMSLSGSSAGGSHGTLPKGETLKSQSKLDCRIGKEMQALTDNRRGVFTARHESGIH